MAERSYKRNLRTGRDINKHTLSGGAGFRSVSSDFYFYMRNTAHIFLRMQPVQTVSYYADAGKDV